MKQNSQAPENKENQASNEPVTRLMPIVGSQERIEATAPKFQQRDRELSTEEKQEEDWGKQNLMTGWWWMLIGGGALVAILVGMVVFSKYLDGPMEVASSEVEVATELDPFEGSPEHWFRKREGKISEEAEELIKSYLSAGDDIAKSKFVRNPEQYLKCVPHWSVKVNPRLENLPKAKWQIKHTGETAFLALRAESEDFLPIRVYFTRYQEGLKLDWKASAAWSEMSVKQLKEVEPSTRNKPVLLRCLISRRDEFYTAPYNEQDHASFMILSPDKSQYLWGYVDRGSELDKELRRIIDHGRFVVDLKKDVRVTLRVQGGGKDTLPSQIELMELVHPEWVQPD